MNDKKRLEMAKRSVFGDSVSVRDPGFFAPASAATALAKNVLKREKLERKIAQYEEKQAKLELQQSKLDDKIAQARAEIAKLR